MFFAIDGRHAVGVVTVLAAASTTSTVIAWLPVDTETANLTVAAISMIAGLVAVWLAWIPLRRTRRTGGLKTPKAMADQIAVAVRRRWEAEVELRRVNDPYTIPVTREPADADLVPSWTALREAACSVGWPEPDRTSWASGPAALAGEGGDVTRVLREVPTGRLVVLGEPGAGKSILAVRLVLDLLARREPGEPVPVLVTRHPGIRRGNTCGTGWNVGCPLTIQLCGRPRLKAEGRVGHGLCGRQV